MVLMNDECIIFSRMYTQLRNRNKQIKEKNKYMVLVVRSCINVCACVYACVYVCVSACPRVNACCVSSVWVYIVSSSP